MNAFRDGIVGLLPYLKNYARSLVRGNAYLVDELVQDTVANALRAERQFTPGTNLKAWLSTILRNRYLSSQNRRYLTAETADDDLEGHGWVPPAQEKAVETAEFRRAFRKLSPVHREVLVLAVLHGMPYDEIARKTNCEVGTVKSRVNRARALLKKLLAEGVPHDRRPEAPGSLAIIPAIKPAGYQCMCAADWEGAIRQNHAIPINAKKKGGGTREIAGVMVPLHACHAWLLSRTDLPAQQVDPLLACLADPAFPQSEEAYHLTVAGNIRYVLMSLRLFMSFVKDAKLVISGMENLQTAVASAPVADDRQAAPGPEASGAFARIARVEVQTGAVLTSSSAFQRAVSGEFAGALTDKPKSNESRGSARHYKR